MTTEEIRAELIKIKEGAGLNTQDKARMMVNFVDGIDDDELFEVYDQFSIDSKAILENDIYNESLAGNLQSIKNKIEDIKDFSASFYYSDGNGNYRDLTEEDVIDCIDEMISRLD